MPPSPFGSLVRHCEEAILPSPPAEPAELTALLDLVSTIPDPPRVRGRRYRLGSLLALCLVAVLGGACSLAQIARFAASSFAGPQPPLAHQQKGAYGELAQKERNDQVCAPMRPSMTMSAHCWKSSVADSVSRPKSPSSSRPASIA